ncbi:alpha/beta fold hydrolase [Sphingomonas sp. 22R3R2A-7]|uniref:alpha/beta fold hydrolase n=1 Tax=Sphingomonas sp. 22R3R2A-7 TaxID=3050230 RepID=UPI002FE1E8A0
MTSRVADREATPPFAIRQMQGLGSATFRTAAPSKPRVTSTPATFPTGSGLAITLLGPLAVVSAATAAKLPPSRKTRALLAYLIVEDRPHLREHLCDLLWDDGPDDPRGALRWSLSKLRAVIDVDRRCLIADRETVALRQDELETDLQRASRALHADIAVADDMVDALVALREPFLAGLDLPRLDRFTIWLAAQREAAERLRRLLLARYVKTAPLVPEDRLPWAREWLDVDRFNSDAADALHATLSQLGRSADATIVEQRFAATMHAAGLPAPTVASPPPGDAALAYDATPTLLQRQKIRFCEAADGVRLAYGCVGQGPPLVKAANWLNHLELDWDAPIWAPIFRELARDHTFVRYDERGNGMSDGAASDISFEAFVQDLETVVDAAGIDRFPLLGLSQGCAVAIAYAVRHPERVSHLILWGGYAAGWRINATPDETAEREAIITLVRQGWGRTDASYRQMVTTTFMPSATPEELDWFNAFQCQTVTPENAARYLEVFADIDVRDILGDVRAPTLVMHARGDRRIPLCQGGELAARIPGAEFVTLDSDNHLLLGREPASDAFVAHVREFLTK